MSTETMLPDDAASQPPSRLTGSDLLGERREVEIEHNAEINRLRLTRAGTAVVAVLHDLAAAALVRRLGLADRRDVAFLMR